MSMSARDYAAIAMRLNRRGSRDSRIRDAVDALWGGVHEAGGSGVGVCLDQPGEPHDRPLVRGPCRNKPACSPIGLHGVCGQALLSRETRIVRDVRELGEKYV